MRDSGVSGILDFGNGKTGGGSCSGIYEKDFGVCIWKPDQLSMQEEVGRYFGSQIKDRGHRTCKTRHGIIIAGEIVGIHNVVANCTGR